MANTVLEQLQGIQSRLGDIREFQEQAKIERTREQEFARGIKINRNWVTVTSAAGAPVTVATLAGPDQGFAWCLLSVSAFLSAAGTMVVSAGESLSQRILGIGSANSSFCVCSLPKPAGLLMPGEPYTVGPSNGTSTFSQVFTVALQVPAEQIFKLVI